MSKRIAKSTLESLLVDEQAFCRSLTDLRETENNLGRIDGGIIGTGRSDYTQDSTEYQLNIQDKPFVLIDIPGIEGNESKYEEIIRNSLRKAHAIFYVNGSGKPLEKNTLEKIRKYMRNGTSVYAISNVHCKAKLNRIPGLDPTYQEDLTAEYEKIQTEIATLTEAELAAFLGENFKKSLYVNGLLAFSSVAVSEDGDSTIIKDESKALHSDQAKFLKEYDGDYTKMHDSSRITNVQEIIEDKVEHFKDYIREENFKKLKTWLGYTLDEVTSLRDKEHEKILKFAEEYDTFENACEDAKKEFVNAVNRIGRTDVEAAFQPLMDALFGAVEKNGGKLKADVINAIVAEHEDEIVETIEQTVFEKLEAANKNYQESVQEAQNRLIKDLEREQNIFENNMHSHASTFTTNDLGTLLKDCFNFDIKGLLGGVLKVAEYTASFLAAGTAICPGIGTVVGGIAGFLVGLISAIKDFFTSKDKRIDRAKGNIKSTIDENVDTVTEQVKDAIAELGIKEKINQTHESLVGALTEQRKSLQDVEQMMDKVIAQLSATHHTL